MLVLRSAYLGTAGPLGCVYYIGADLSLEALKMLARSEPLHSAAAVMDMIYAVMMLLLLRLRGN